MAYRDTAKIRSHVVKVRFSDEEHRLLDALADYTGEQKAPLIREMVLSQVCEILSMQNGTYEAAIPVPVECLNQGY